MVLTKQIAFAILAFAPITTLAVPLTTANMNNPDGVTDFGPMPLTVAENGIMLPGARIETTKTGLPFDSHPDNLEDFPQIVATLTSATAPTGTARRHRGHFGNRPVIHDETVDGHEHNPRFRPGKRGGHGSVVFGRPHDDVLAHHGDERAAFHPFGRGGHGPVVNGHPYHNALDHTDDGKPDFHPLNLGGHGPTVPMHTGTLQRHGDGTLNCNPTGQGGHGPVVHGECLQAGPLPTGTFSKHTGGPLHEIHRPTPKNITIVDGHKIVARNVEVSHSIYSSLASTAISAAVQAANIVATTGGNQVLSEHEAQIEHFAHKIAHPGTKPHNHKGDHKGNNSAGTPDNNSTCAGDSKHNPSREVADDILVTEGCRFEHLERDQPISKERQQAATFDINHLRTLTSFLDDYAHRTNTAVARESASIRAWVASIQQDSSAHSNPQNHTLHIGIVEGHHEKRDVALDSHHHGHADRTSHNETAPRAHGYGHGHPRFRAHGGLIIDHHESLMHHLWRSVKEFFTLHKHKHTKPNETEAPAPEHAEKWRRSGSQGRVIEHADRELTLARLRASEIPVQRDGKLVREDSLQERCVGQEDEFCKYVNGLRKKNGRY